MAEGSKDGISRRRLLGGAAAGAGGIAAGGMVGAPVAGAKPATRKADVVVVGAGLAGLRRAAARARGPVGRWCWRRATASAAGS